MKTNIYKFIITIFACILVTSCASNYTNVRNKLAACGIDSAKFKTFTECAHKTITIDDEDSKDYYTQVHKEVLSTIDDLNSKVTKKKMKQDSAYHELNSYLNNKIYEEAQMSQNATTFLAIAAASAAVVSCANSGGCAGGSSYAPTYPCDCPGDIAADGSRCGARSSYSRSGGRSPYCPPNRL